MAQAVRQLMQLFIWWMSRHQLHHAYAHMLMSYLELFQLYVAHNIMIFHIHTHACDAHCGCDSSIDRWFCDSVIHLSIDGSVMVL